MDQFQAAASEPEAGILSLGPARGRRAETLSVALQVSKLGDLRKRLNLLNFGGGFRRRNLSPSKFQGSVLRKPRVDSSGCEAAERLKLVGRPTGRRFGPARYPVVVRRSGRGASRSTTYGDWRHGPSRARARAPAKLPPDHERPAPLRLGHRSRTRTPGAPRPRLVNVAEAGAGGASRLSLLNAAGAAEQRAGLRHFPRGQARASRSGRRSAVPPPRRTPSPRR